MIDNPQFLMYYIIYKIKRKKWYDANCFNQRILAVYSMRGILLYRCSRRDLVRNKKIAEFCINPTLNF